MKELERHAISRQAPYIHARGNAGWNDAYERGERTLTGRVQRSQSNSLMSSSLTAEGVKTPKSVKSIVM